MKSGNDVDFFYLLEQYGWSTCYIHLGGAIYGMGPTHIFDNPLSVLLDHLSGMIAGENEVEFKWHDEPGEYNWKITRNKIQHHKVVIQISDCYQVGSKSGLKDIEFEVKLKLFSICVLKQVEKIEELFKEKSYRENRDFPYHEFSNFRRVFEKVYK